MSEEPGLSCSGASEKVSMGSASVLASSAPSLGADYVGTASPIDASALATAGSILVVVGIGQGAGDAVE